TFALSIMSKKKIILSIVSLLILAVIGTIVFFIPKPQQPEEPEPEEVVVIPFSDSLISILDHEVDDYLQKMGFNGSVAILYKGVPLYKNCQGRYNLLRKSDSITFSTTFQLASVSKPFTSMAVMMLWEQGKIQIEDQLQKYIPEFPYPEITIHQLLNHTSGLQDYTKLVEQNWDEDKVITNEDLLKLLIEHHLPLNFASGKRHSYSNTGYTMLALLVERVTQTPYHQWVKENIFMPAGMQTAWVWNPTAADTMNDCAIGYISRSRKARYYPHVKCDEIVGDKSVFCSINDMICWDKAIRQRMFVSDTTMQKAWLPSKIIKKEVAYGLGWRIKDFGDRHAVYHNGKWNGFTASHTRFNQEEITILLLSNTRDKAAQLTNKMQEKVFSILYSDYKTGRTENDEEDTEVGGAQKRNQ
ncbi:MAG: serine hydrolase, partial [Bacteroidales bacterium]|nr:serine hydrolase [Bacteroidales bacterium]